MSLVTLPRRELIARFARAGLQGAALRKRVREIEELRGMVAYRASEDGRTVKVAIALSEYEARRVIRHDPFLRRLRMAARVGNTLPRSGTRPRGRAPRGRRPVLRSRARSPGRLDPDRPHVARGRR